jgi:hypothetical protein
MKREKGTEGKDEGGGMKDEVKPTTKVPRHQENRNHIIGCPW